MLVVDWYNAKTYLLLFLISCAVLIPVALLVGRKLNRPALIAVLFAMSVAVVATLTLPTDFADMGAFPAPQFTVSGFLRHFFTASAPAQTFTDLLTAPEHLANILLYIPAGVLGYVFLKKWWLALATAVVLSFTLELIQAMSGVRDGSPIDFCRNCTGAVGGIIVVVCARFVGLLDHRNEEVAGTARIGKGCIFR